MLYSEPFKKDYILAKKQAHLISESILAKIGKLKANNIDNNTKEFTIDFSKILQDNKITEYLDEKEETITSFSMYHEENIVKMQMIINYLIDNIQINSLYLTVFIDTLFNLVIKPASTDEYDYKKLNLELDIIYQQLCSSKKNTSSDYTIREISNKLLTLI